MPRLRRRNPAVTSGSTPTLPLHEQRRVGELRVASRLEVRAEWLRRTTRSRGDRWTVADMHHLAALILSLPGFALMRGGGTSPQPPLHPVLSSLFRISDGIRMTTHDMLFLSSERTRDPDELFTAEDLYGFAERNGLFLAERGVCAGPRAPIDELLAIAFDGVRVEGADSIELAPEIKELLTQLPAAVNYGLLGLQVWGLTRALWCQMSLVYKAMRVLFDGASGSAAERFHARLEADWQRLDHARIAGDYDRDVHMVVYRDCYEQAGHALPAQRGDASFAARIAPVAETGEHRALASALQAILAERFADTTFPASDPAQLAARLAALLVDYLRQEQAMLGAAVELQEALNTLLERPRPTRPLTARDLRVNYAMYGGYLSQFPYLFDSLDQELGFRVEATATSLELRTARERAA